MRVEMVTLSAGPGGVLQPGDVVDLPADEARALLDGGYAVPVGRGQPETADAADGEETTARRPGKRPQRRKDTPADETADAADGEETTSES